MKINKKYFNITIFTMLSLSLFLNSSYKSSSANDDVPYNRYELLEGEFLKVNYSDEDVVKDIEIYGNTVQNKSDLGDIRSVGDLYVDDAGNPILDSKGNKQYKIDIISTGKNIFDGNLEIGAVSATTGMNADKDTWQRNVGYINVEANKTYICSIDEENVSFGVRAYDVNKNYLGNVTLYNGRFTAPSNAHYIRFNITTDKDVKVQIEEGSVATEYEPYKESKLTILSTTPLERIGDVKDRIVKKNGVWGVEKNIETIYAKDCETSQGLISPAGLSAYYVYYPIRYTAVTDEDMISNKLPIGNYYSDFDCVYGQITEFVVLSKNIPTLSDFNNYIKDLYFKFKLINPYFIPLPNSQQIEINTFLDETRIFSQTENGVYPTLKVNLDRINKIARDTVTEAENNTTINSISIARMWVNQMKESILKDKFNEKLNLLYDIDDLGIDKKSVTANVDIYIKSKNALAMSLSTSSICFEDFSVANDLEYLNAVEITMQSSLPYELQVYLESEIYNKDKTEILDKSILSVKSSGESDYKSFIDLNTPIKLGGIHDVTQNKVHSVDIKLSGGRTHKTDVYKTTLKFEAIQK